MSININLESPTFENRIVCVSDDYALTAQISSCFTSKNQYFTVLEPPRSFHKYWRNEFIQLNNVIARLHPNKVVFVNLKEKMTLLIKEQLKINESRYGYIDNQSDIEEFITRNKFEFKGVLKCQKDRKLIAHALLEAKRKNLRLVICEDANYKVSNEKLFNHIVASNSSDDLLPVLLANYCFSIDADLTFFSNLTDHDPSDIYKILGDTRGTDRRASLARSISSEINKNIYSNLSGIENYEFITFFTADFEYGYFFPSIPSTHIYNNLLPGHFLASSIVQNCLQINSAVLVDTGFFKNSETSYISDVLNNNGTIVKELKNDQFSNLDLDQIIQYYPYDFLFICSHAGFPKGERFKIKFKDKNDYEHIIVVDVVHSFDPTNKGEGNDRIISVKTITEFVELDGCLWHEKKKRKGESDTLVEDFLANDSRNWIVLEKSDVEMRHCNVVITKDKLGPYIPMLHSISDPESTPFVFNNACLSNYTMSGNIIFAGARFYIGTVKSLPDSYAVKTAKLFFEKTINEKKNLAISLWEAQHNQTDYPDKVYTCVGCHFMKFDFRTREQNLAYMKQRLLDNIYLRRKASSKIDKEKNVAERHKEAAILLLREYNNL